MKKENDTPQTGNKQETPSSADRGIQAVLEMEKRNQEARSPVDHLSSWIIKIAGSGTTILVHIVWFSLWVILNSGALGVTPFDPFPFNFLTMMVSLEAIFLTLFVLASQNRMAQEEDKRAHLDLQINILAERETTMILQMLREISNHLGLKGPSQTDLDELAKDTRIDELATKLDGALPMERSQK